MTLDLGSKGSTWVDGTSAILFSPTKPIEQLVFRLWPNSPGQAASLRVGRVLVDGDRQPAAPLRRRSGRRDQTALVVPLGRTIPAGREVRIALTWRLRLTPAGFRLNSRAGFLRLASFFPILPWDPRRGWVSDPPTTLPAEAWSSPTADFDVTVRAARADRVVATGVETSPGRWLARGVRDFALAAGPFVQVSRTVKAPEPVRLAVATSRAGRARAPAFADRAARALRVLSRRYGPYPWGTLSIAVMPDLGQTGIEYPNLIFQGPNSLVRATTHEVAHQWFYSLVGNDQGRDPWLDEALANWAAMLIDGSYSILLVPIPPEAQGKLGAPVSYWEEHPSGYVAGVYVQGPQALAALGNPTAVNCALRRYVAANAYRIARPHDLLAQLERVLPGATTILARFGVHAR